MQITKIMIVLVLGALLKNRYSTCILRISVYVKVTFMHGDSCLPAFHATCGRGSKKKAVFLGSYWPFDEVKISHQK